MPDFIVVGPPRTGTTWLYNVLCSMPNIYMPEEKQIHFFDKNYDKGTRWYRQYFRSAHLNQRVGEVTPDYISSKKVLERIHATIPNVKIILIYRNPVDRAISHFKIRARNGMYGKKMFKDVFEEDKYLMENSLYGKHLQRLIDIFPSENILVLDFASLNTEAQEAIDAIANFLGVEKSKVGDTVLKKRYADSLPATRWKWLDKYMVRIREWFGCKMFSRTVLEPIGRALYRRIRGINSHGGEKISTDINQESLNMLREDGEMFVRILKASRISYWQGK